MARSRCSIPPAIIRRPLGEPKSPHFQIDSLASTRLKTIVEKLNVLEPGGSLDLQLLGISKEIKSACRKEQDVGIAVDLIRQYSLQSKQSAHVGAIVCNYLRDLEVAGTNFEILLLGKIYWDYEDREEKYKQLGLFLNHVTFMCEVFHHVKLPGGHCIKSLVPAIDCYFSMLLNGGSEEEILVLSEQLPKCHTHIRNNYPEQYQDLVFKMKMTITSKSSSEATRSLLLQTFELLQNEGALADRVKSLYQLYTKTTSNFCE